MTKNFGNNLVMTKIIVINSIFIFFTFQSSFNWNKSCPTSLWKCDRWKRRRKKKERWTNFDYQNLYIQTRIAFQRSPHRKLYVYFQVTWQHCSECLWNSSWNCLQSYIRKPVHYLKVIFLLFLLLAFKFQTRISQLLACYFTNLDPNALGLFAKIHT